MEILCRILINLVNYSLFIYLYHCFGIEEFVSFQTLWVYILSIGITLIGSLVLSCIILFSANANEDFTDKWGKQ